METTKVYMVFVTYPDGDCNLGCYFDEADAKETVRLEMENGNRAEYKEMEAQILDED